jgi:acetyl-CoA synthetase
MIRTIHGDKDRYQKTYWSDYPGLYTAGDGARRDKDGNFWIIGRLDDVLNVSGHRLGTAEIESALVSHPAVAEAAVIGRPDDLKGQAVAAFVTLKGGFDESPELREQLRGHVGKVIGAIAKPDDLFFTPGLPKTRSGKIMRRLLKELVTTGTVAGNVTTLEDFSVVENLQRQISESRNNR